MPLLVCGSASQLWLFQQSPRISTFSSTKVQMHPKPAQCVSQKLKHVWLVCIMNEKAGHYQIWLCRHWVGGSGVVKLSFYRSNPGKRTTVLTGKCTNTNKHRAVEKIFLNTKSNIVQGSNTSQREESAN